MRRWISSTGTPAAVARAPSSCAMRSVPNLPGASPLIRTGAISSTSDLMRPARPGPDQVGGRQGGDRLADRARQDDQDGRIATVAEVRQRGPQDADGAPQRPVERLLPGRLVEVLEPPGRRAAGVDHEQVESAECLDRGRHRRRRTVRGRQVGRHGQGIEPRRLGIEPLAAARDQADLGALCPEDRRDRASETAAAAADERSRAVESEVHRVMVAGRVTARAA